MPSADNSSPNSSGIATSTAGDRHIPASVRADGSMRKERKIRPGYKPPEDVEVYKNRTAESWKARGSGGVPGAAAIQEADSKSTNNKNAKRREARKRAKGTEETAQDSSEKVQVEQNAAGKTAEDGANASSRTPDGDKGNEETGTAAESEQLDPEAEKEKQARNLKKKLRQARELREKKDKGQNLLPEQFEKVIKINELIRQLDGLGFDAEGNPKSG